MKNKYHLARLMDNRLQYSDDYWTSYKEAIRVRSRQVNPSQWLIVINPELHSLTKRINLEVIKINQGQLLNETRKLLKNAVDMINKLTY